MDKCDHTGEYDYTVDNTNASGANDDHSGVNDVVSIAKQWFDGPLAVPSLNIRPNHPMLPRPSQRVPPVPTYSRLYRKCPLRAGRLEYTIGYMKLLLYIHHGQRTDELTIKRGSYRTGLRGLLRVTGEQDIGLSDEY